MYQGAACDRTEPGSGLGGPHDRREASRTPFTVLQLATSGLDGAPKVRRVILRGAVSFFTDVRSAKIEEIRHPPRGSLLGYDADAGFQMRLEARRPWTPKVGKRLRLGRAVDLNPGALQASAAFRDPDRRSSRSAPADDVDGERHFAVIVVSVIRIGWLDTSRSLHLHGRDGRDWRGGWVST
jgi:pyridoxamine 5'-phosphate oxidase